MQGEGVMLALPAEILEKIFIHLPESSLLELTRFEEFTFLHKNYFWRRKAYYEYDIPAWYFDLSLESFFWRGPLFRYFEVGRKVRTSLTSLKVLDKAIVLRDLYLRGHLDLFFDLSKVLPEQAQKALKNISCCDFPSYDSAWEERLLGFCAGNKKLLSVCQQYIMKCCKLSSFQEFIHHIQINQIPSIYYFFPLVSLRGKWGHALIESNLGVLKGDYQLFEDLLVSSTFLPEANYPFFLLEVFATEFNPINLSRVLEYAYKYAKLKIIEAIEQLQSHEILSLSWISDCVCWGVDHISHPLDYYKVAQKVLGMAIDNFKQTNKGLYQIRRLKNHPLASFLKVRDRDILRLFLSSNVFSLELLRENLFNGEVCAVGYLLVSYLEREGNVKKFLQMTKAHKNVQVRDYLLEIYSKWKGR